MLFDMSRDGQTLLENEGDNIADTSNSYSAQQQLIMRQQTYNKQAVNYAYQELYIRNVMINVVIIRSFGPIVSDT
jgi:hypothetical protein